MPNVTICSLHDNITNQTKEILKLIQLLDNKIDEGKPNLGLDIGFLDDFISDIKVSLIESILDDTAHAKDCGQRMEDALIERKQEIKDLQETIEGMEDRIEYLKSELDYHMLDYQA